MRQVHGTTVTAVDRRAGRCAAGLRRHRHRPAWRWSGGAGRGLRADPGRRPGGRRDRGGACRPPGCGRRDRGCGCSSQMTALGAAPGDITVVLGPAICGRCYEVPSSMRDEVEAALPGLGEHHRPGHARPRPARRAGPAAARRRGRRCGRRPALHLHRIEPVQPSPGRANRPVCRPDLDAALIMKRSVADAGRNVVQTGHAKRCVAPRSPSRRR